MDEEPDDELFEGIRIIDEQPDDVATPGRSVFADDDDDLDDVDELDELDEVDAAPGAAPVPEPPDDDDLAAWSSLNDATPRWREDDVDDLPPVAPPQVVGASSGVDDFFSFEDTDDTGLGDFGRAAATEPPDVFGDRGPFEDSDPTEMTTVPIIGGEPEPSRSAGGPMGPSGATGGGGGGERDIPMAVATGAGLAVVAIVAFLISPAVSVVLATVVLTLAAAEFYNAVRQAGHQPAVLLGLVATASLSLGAYYRGEAAIPAILFLTVVFGMIWYLTGVGTDAPVRNLGVTLLGVLYVGVLGAFAAVMLQVQGATGMLASAVIVTIAYDVGAFVVGRAGGRSPLSAVSPNKTVEGVIGGAVAAVLAAVIVVRLIGTIEPFGDDPGSFVDAVLLGIVGAVAATLGDLCESLLKRDLGLKDMGSILPGHGGLLDRFDGLLFVLPSVYYLGLVVL